MADAKALTDIATSYTTLAGGDLFGVERSGTVGKFTWNSFQTQDMALSGNITFTGTVDLSGATITGATAFAALSASGVLSVASDIQHIGDTNNKIAFGTDTQSFETGGTARIDLSDSGVRFGATGARVTDIETTITDSDTKLPTSGAVVDYVTAEIASAPSGRTLLGALTMSGTTQTLSGLTLADYTHIRLDFRGVRSSISSGDITVAGISVVSPISNTSLYTGFVDIELDEGHLTSVIAAEGGGSSFVVAGDTGTTTASTSITVTTTSVGSFNAGTIRVWGIS